LYEHVIAVLTLSERAFIHNDLFAATKIGEACDDATSYCEGRAVCEKNVCTCNPSIRMSEDKQLCYRTYI